MLYEYAYTFLLVIRHVEELIDELGWQQRKRQMVILKIQR
jgi:hypothetical protein